jgi:hypothetical protein
MDELRLFFEGRDVRMRCVCGHLLFIHFDEDRTIVTGDEPPHGIVRERKGHCMHALCACKRPQAQTAVQVPPPLKRGPRGATIAAVRRDVA